MFSIIQLEDVDSHLQPWKHNDEDPLGINWYLIEEALKESKYTEKYLDRKITDEELKKLEEVAKVIAKFVDAWGPDNINHAQIWLAEGKNMDDLEEFIKKYAKDPEKAFQYLEELRQVMHKYIKPKGLRPPTTGAPATKAATKIITKKEPSVEDLTIETLKGMGMDLKLETGNIAERKANIYSWLKENGLIKVEKRDGRKIVRPTEKLHALVGKHGGNVAAAMIKWAAEEGVGLEHVEPVAKILAALEEYRQIAKKQDPKLAKALEKAMRSKHTIRELYLTLAGEMTLKELSKKWESYGFNLLDLLRENGELRNAFRKAMEELEKAGLGSLLIPKNWAERLKDGNINAILELATAERLFYSALESVAIRGLPGKGKEIIHLLEEILSRVPGLVPYIKDTPEELKGEVRELAEVLALMEDESYLEILEERLSPLVEKIPETKKMGLFRRESPRRRVEDFTALLFEGNLSWEEAEKKAGELRDYLSDYLSKEEAETLISGIMLPFKARKFLKKYGTAEGFLFEYAHARASRMLGIEALIWEATKSNDDFYDSLVKSLAFLPAVEGYEKVHLKKFKKNKETLSSLMNKFD